MIALSHADRKIIAPDHLTRLDLDHLAYRTTAFSRTTCPTICRTAKPVTTSCRSGSTTIFR